MKPLLTSLLLLSTLVTSAPALAEPVAFPTAPAPTPRQSYLHAQNEAMGVLTGWALTSIATGALLWTTGTDDYTRGIGMQNVAWGAIDGAIAGFGAWGIAKESKLVLSAADWNKKQRQAKTIFLINAGLDLLYITTGAALLGLGKTDQVRGAGAGIVMQGSFLFVFDTAMAMH